MHVLKWTPFFDIKEESPIVPIWISFPNLRLHFFNSKVLHALGSIFGRPLQTDQATASKTRPCVARVLVEVDISKKHPKEVWVGSKAYGYMQKAEFEKVPEFCNHCKMHGHAIAECFKLNPDLKKNVVQPSGGPGSTVNNKVYVPIVNKDLEENVIQAEPSSAMHNVSLDAGEGHVLGEKDSGKEIVLDKSEEVLNIIGNSVLNNKGKEIVSDPKLLILVDDMLNEMPINSNSVAIENALIANQDFTDLGDGGSNSNLETYEEGEVIPESKDDPSSFNNQGTSSSPANLKVHNVVEEDVVSKGGKKKGKQDKNNCPATPRSTRAHNSYKKGND
ncbi:hypothetical protein KFK09_000739 [Dendrobium nobile]|uniref:DUF4283 domain-containing protein n=1 Tax=Dendrobium nobile TaxID=94219 RepID=A0A8T3CBX7_DENNO|nr:hypothetical protein KFK09_000739 [Dendrobium nobile]